MDMKKLILLIIVLCSASHLSATEQEPEVIIYKRRTYKMYSAPLEPYFDTHPKVRQTWRSIGYVQPDGSVTYHYGEGIIVKV